MTKLIIIDDVNCKQDLDLFLNKHTDSIKMIVDDQNINLVLDMMINNKLEMNNRFLLQESNNFSFCISDIQIIEKITDSKIKLYFFDDRIEQIEKEYSELTNMLEVENFYKISASQCVNIKFIRKIVLKDKYIVEMENNIKLKINPTYLDKLLDMINDNMNYS